MSLAENGAKKNMKYRGEKHFLVPASFTLYSSFKLAQF